MKRKLKWMIITILFSSLFFTGSLQVFSYEEYLVVSVLDANYPPVYIINSVNHFTFVQFEIQIQIENPTQFNIRVNYTCSLIPFPCFLVNFENKSLYAIPALFIEWVAGSYNVPSGLSTKISYITFYIHNYEKEILPLGNYTFWFDYINCCSVPVPVITEKLNIQVARSTITYFYEYNNETVVFDTPTPTPTFSQTTQTNQASYVFSSISTFIFFMIVILKSYKRKKKL